MKTYRFAAILIVSMFLLTLVPLATTPASGAPVTTQSYPSGGPRPDGIVYKIYTDAIAEYLALKANEIDLMDWPIDKSQIPDALAQRTAGVFNVSEQPDAGFYYIGSNCLAARFPMNITGFRKALAHLTDKATAVSTGLGGYGYVMENIVPQAFYGEWGNHTVTTYAYSKILANQTLWDYGFSYTGTHSAFPFTGGYWEYNGQPVRDWDAAAANKLLMFIRSDDPGRKLAGETLRDNLIDLGFPVTASVTSSAGISPIVYYAPWDDWDIFTGGWSTGAYPTYLWDFFNSESSESYNFIFWNNASYDYWSNIFVQDPDRADTLAAAYRCEELIADGCPYIPIYQRQLVTAGRTSWQGYVDALGTGYPNVWSLMELHKTGTQWGSQLRFGMAQDILSLNIVTATWVWDFFVLNEIYDTLIAIDPYTLEIEPWMASSYDVTTFNWSASEMGTKIAYALRNNITWQDGVPFTAEDVKFSYEWLTYSEARGGINAPRYSLPFVIHNVTVTDDYHVTLYINNTGYWTLFQSSIYMIPKHVWDRYTSYAQVQALRPERAGLVIGTGPYAFVDYVPGEYCRLTAFTNYFRTPVGRPSIALGEQISVQQGAAATIPIGKIYQNTTLGDVSGNRIDNASVFGALYGGALISELAGNYDPGTHEYFFSVDTSSLTPGTYEITGNAYWTLVTAGSYQWALQFANPRWSLNTGASPTRVPMQDLEFYFELYDGTNDIWWIPANMTSGSDGDPAGFSWFNASLLWRRSSYGWKPLWGDPATTNTTYLTMRAWDWNGTSQSYDIPRDESTSFKLTRSSGRQFSLEVWTGNLTNGAQYGITWYYRFVNRTTLVPMGRYEVWAGRGSYWGDGWTVEWPTSVVVRAYVFGLNVAAPPAWYATGVGLFAIGATVAAVLVAAGLGYSLLRAKKTK